MADRRPIVATLAMIASTVSWRAGTYYSGGADPVVVLKALLSIVALVIAYKAANTMPQRFELGTRSFWLLGSYLLASVFGAWWFGNLLASGVLAIRLAILAATVYFLLRAYAARLVVTTLVQAMAAIAVLGAVTGIQSVLSGKRLHGLIPPLTSNELAFLCATTFLALVWRGLHGERQRYDPIVMVVFLGMIWESGSRTGLAAMLFAIIVMLVQVRRWPVSGFLTAVVLFPVIIYAVVGAGLLSSYLGRGGTANVSNLSNRTVAWSAAAHLYDNTWGKVFGSGLSVKQIPVAGQWWNVQILDSSWVSALVQAGIVGLALLGLWSLWNLVSTAIMPRPDRLLYLSLLVFIVFRSVLESGLLDATPAFCVFFAISLLSEERSRRASVLRLIRLDPQSPPNSAGAGERAAGAAADRPLSPIR